MLGIPAYMRDEPIESIIYETLLGGYFGYKTRPAHEAEGGQFFQSLRNGNESEVQFRPSSHERWNDFSKKAQDYINNKSILESKDYIHNKMGNVGRKTPEQKDNYIKSLAFFGGEKELKDFTNKKNGKYTGEVQKLIDRAYQSAAY